MNALQDNHIDYIYKDLKARGLTIDVLIDEMVDHICCMLEPELYRGMAFQSAYSKIINNLEDNTFRNIQHQTLLSTNLKYQDMKKSMFSLGVLGALLLTTGTFLKSMHLPFAGINMFVGVVIVIFGFLPLFFYTMYKEQAEKKNVLLSIAGYLTASFLIAGVLFRIMHWPGTFYIMFIGKILLVVLFLPVYLVNVFKKANETRTNFIYVIIIVGIGIGVIYMSSMVSISKEIVDKYDLVYRNSMNVTRLFTTRNDSLITSLAAKDTTGKNREQIEQIKKLSSKLDEQITELKEEMIKSAGGEKATPENFGSKDNRKVYSRVMKREDNALKLKKNFENYRNYLSSLAKDEYQRQMINTCLDFSLSTGNMYEQSFESTSMIEAMAMLSGIQKNMKIAEYEILKSL